MGQTNIKSINSLLLCILGYCTNWEVTTEVQKIDEDELDSPECKITYKATCPGQEIYPVPKNEEEGTYFMVTSATEGGDVQSRLALGMEPEFKSVGDNGIDDKEDTVQVETTIGEYIVGYGSPKDLRVNFAVEGHPNSMQELSTTISKCQ